MDNPPQEFPPSFVRMVWVDIDPFVGPSYTVGALVSTPAGVTFIESPAIPSPPVIGADKSAWVRAVVRALKKETNAKSPKRISLAVRFGEPMELTAPAEMGQEFIDAFITRMWTRAET